MTSLQERLDNNEIILMDGGISTEIQKRGVLLDANVWSGLTTKTHPNEVRQVHEDYIPLKVETTPIVLVPSLRLPALLMRALQRVHGTESKVLQCPC